MMLSDLIDNLQDMLDDLRDKGIEDMEVVKSADYGDHCHTIQALPISCAGEEIRVGLIQSCKGYSLSGWSLVEGEYEYEYVKREANKEGEEFEFNSEEEYNTDMKFERRVII